MNFSYEWAGSESTGRYHFSLWELDADEGHQDRLAA